MEPAQRRSRFFALATAVLLIGTIISFWPVRRNGFILVDDPVYITRNRQVTAGLTIPGVLWAVTATTASNWHPVTWVAHMLDSSLFGLNPAGHHATSVIVHAAAALLLFLVLADCTGRPGWSLVVAALFALHPLRVESVAWAAEKKDVLAALLWMLTLGAYVRYARRPGWARYGLVLVSFAFGLAAKPMVVSLPFVLLLLDWWPLGRFAACSRTGRWGRLAAEKIPLVTLSLLSSVVTWQVQRASGAVWALEQIPVGPRLLNAVLTAVSYLGKTLWPIKLSPLYPLTGMDFAPAFAFVACCVLLVATLLVVRRRTSQPWMLFGWLWYLGTLLPVIGIVQVGWQGMADRYTYLPLIGPVLALVWTVGSTATPTRRLAAPAVGVVLLMFGALTWLQTTFWRDSVSIFTRAVAMTRRNGIAEYYLGSALRFDHRPEEAERHLNEAIRLNPGFGEPYLEKGMVILEAGDAAAAVPWLERAVALMPTAAVAHLSLGEALEGQGALAEALRESLAAAALDPSLAQAHIASALLLERLGRPAEAAEHIRQARNAIMSRSESRRGP